VIVRFVDIDDIVDHHYLDFFHNFFTCMFFSYFILSRTISYKLVTIANFDDTGLVNSSTSTCLRYGILMN